MTKMHTRVGLRTLKLAKAHPMNKVEIIRAVEVVEAVEVVAVEVVELIRVKYSSKSTL